MPIETLNSDLLIVSPPRIGIAAMRPIFCFRRNSGAPLLNERWVRTSLERSVSLEDTAQVRLAEHDEVVERFATNQSDEPFDVGVCHGERGAVR